jgi:hypothetical protein
MALEGNVPQRLLDVLDAADVRETMGKKATA